MDAPELTGVGNGVDQAMQRVVDQARQRGVAVIVGAFDLSSIRWVREQVLEHRHLLKNTRPTPSSGHLAGFHQYPELAPLHALITDNRRIQAHLEQLLGQEPRTIGLSDITVNRSQPWHKDLLRGSYRHYLDPEGNCARHHGKLFKVIAYLQDSDSLQFVPGSHRQDILLVNDDHAVPTGGQVVERLQVAAGDAVLIDICITHRGSDEAACQTKEATERPRILISTVFGGRDCPFTDRMEEGNAVRLEAWRLRHDQNDVGGPATQTVQALSSDRA